MCCLAFVLSDNLSVCHAGQQETPVFALPLLLRSDKWAQDLFQHTVRWEFKCTFCSYAVSDR